jgi:hypothetical protein
LASGVSPRPGFAFSRRHIPPELIVERAGMRYSSPALTAIDLATLDCADAIDHALRSRSATLAGMYEALRMTPNRVGNQEQLKLLIDFRSSWRAVSTTLTSSLRA